MVSSFPPRRCALVLPANAAKLRAKARSLRVDEVVLDLEDAVAPEGKADARAQALDELRDPAWAGRTVAVRVNAPGSPWWEDDLAALATVPDGPTMTVVVPKAEDPMALLEAARRLPERVGLQALVETPAGIAAAAELAGCPRVHALVLGYADLAAALGRRGAERQPDSWLVHRELVLAAARRAGRQAIDGPFLGLGDDAGLVAQAGSARDLGFDGKWAIHPAQVEPITALFRPTPAELDDARAVVRLLDDLADGGGAAARHGGAMVDEASRRHALRVLATAGPDAEPGPSRVHGARHVVSAPYYDDLPQGRSFVAPGVTVDEGTAALHRAVTGSRLALALDRDLCAAVTGRRAPLAHPALIADLVIGASTEPSARVLGNLFYRRVLLHPAHVGTTVRTRTRVHARRRASGTRPRGLVELEIEACTPAGDPVASMRRCPLLPVHDDRCDAAEGTIRAAGDELGLEAAAALVPDAWDLAPLLGLGGSRGGDLSPGDRLQVEAVDTVTAAPELARLTLNMAYAHTDGAAGRDGRRLVYGGHVIALALAHVGRAFPALATVLAWRSCDHLAPTFEDERLRTTIEVEDVLPRAAGGTVCGLRVRSEVLRAPGLAAPVLDWRPIVLLP